MNYGREAYEKATELERRLSGASSFGVSGIPFALECPPNEKTTVAVYTGGAALVLVSITSVGEGEVDVLFDGLRVGGVPAGGAATAVFAASGAGKVEVLPGENVTVRSAFVSAFGTACAFDENVSPLAADGSDGNVVAALPTGGLSIFRSEGGAFVRVCELGAADDFDIALGANGDIAVGMTNADGGLLLLLRDGVPAGNVVLPGCRLVSVTGETDGYTAAFYDGNRIVVSRLNADFERTESVTAHTSKTVGRVRLIKHSPTPCAAITDGGKNFVRASAAEARVTLHAPIAVSATVTEE